MATSNKLLSAQGLVIEAYSDVAKPGQHLPTSAASAEAQIHFIIGNLTAYQRTGNRLAREAAELALTGLLRYLYRGTPLPDTFLTSNIFSPNVAANATTNINATVINYAKLISFTAGVGYITGPDNVAQVYKCIPVGAVLTWANPYAPIQGGGTTYTVQQNWSYVSGFGTRVQLTSAFTGDLWIVHSTKTGQVIRPGQVLGDWPDWSTLRPTEIRTPGHLYADAAKAFALAGSLLPNPTWALAAHATRLQAQQVINVNGWREYITPNWAYNPKAMSQYTFSTGTRVPAATIQNDDNGAYLIVAEPMTSGSPNVSLSHANLGDTWLAADSLEVVLGSALPMTVQVYLDSDLAVPAGTRWTSVVTLDGIGPQTFTLGRTTFKNNANVTLPVGTPVVRCGVLFTNTAAIALTIQRVRMIPVPNFFMPRMPGLVPYMVYIGANPTQVLDIRGPTYIGFQSPDISLQSPPANTTAATNQAQLLRDAQDAWPTQAGQPGKGPFVPVYYPERYDIFEYGTRQTFGWAGPDYRTNWGGYQYRPVLEMIAAMGRLAVGNSTRNLLITIVNNTLNWLAQDLIWLPMWAPWSNRFSLALEQTVALTIDGTVPVFPTRPPLGPPTDFPQGAAEINRPDPQLAAMILMATVRMDLINRPGGNPEAEMKIELRALLSKSLALLEAMYNKTGNMAGTFSPNAAADEWYGAWHGDILEALSQTYYWATRGYIGRTDIAALVLPWINGMLAWGKAHTGVTVNPLTRTVWRYAPNWSAGMTEEFEYSTAIFRSFSGKEQRQSMRVDPRRRLTMTHLLSRDEARSYDTVLKARQNTPVSVPQWHMSVRSIEAAPAGQDFIVTAPIPANDFTIGLPIAIIANGTLVTATLASVDVLGRITLVESLAVAIPAYSKIVPTNTALLNGEINSTRHTSAALVSQVGFSFLPQEDTRKLPEIAAPMTFTVGTDTREVILTRPNWSTSPTVGHTWATNDTLTYLNGPVTVVNGEQAGARTISATWTLMNQAQIDAHLGLIRRLHGKRYAAWLPSWTDDFVLTRASTILNRLFVKPNESCDLGLLDDECIGIFLRMRDGSSYAARVTSTVFGSTEYSLILDRSLPVSVTPAQIHTFCLLYRVRQMSDTASLKWVTDQAVETTVTFTSVFDEL